MKTNLNIYHTYAKLTFKDLAGKERRKIYRCFDRGIIELSTGRKLTGTFLGKYANKHCRSFSV